MGTLTSTSTGHVSSDVVQRSEIAYFFMAMSTWENKAGQGASSGPAVSGQGLFLGPD